MVSKHLENMLMNYNNTDTFVYTYSDNGTHLIAWNGLSSGEFRQSDCDADLSIGLQEETHTRQELSAVTAVFNHLHAAQWCFHYINNILAK